MEAFFLYRQAEQGSLDIVNSALLECGFERVSTLSSSTSVETELKSAKLLLVFIGNENDFSDRALSDRWRFFQNELRWKRKLEGDILLVLDNNIDEKRIPLTLRDLPFAKLGESGDNIKDCIDKILIGDRVSPINRTRECAGEAALAAAAKQALERKRDQNGCTDDHIFESGTKARTPYLERLSAALEKKREREVYEKADRVSRTSVSNVSVDDLYTDVGDMDNAIKDMEKDVKRLENEAKSAINEIDDAAAKLSKDDVTLSFKGLDTRISLNSSEDDKNRVYHKGNEDSLYNNNNKTNSNDPFGEGYNRPYNEYKKQEKKKGNSTIGAIIFGIVVWIFIVVIFNILI